MLPLPLLLTQLLLAPPGRWAAGLLLLATGEALRMWAVAHIGPASRTRGDAPGPLAISGPYRITRNPLYIGNGLIWLGVGCLGGAHWALAWAVSWLLIYPVVVRWEEHRLGLGAGAAYAEWRLQVPRWFPRWPLGPPTPRRHSWVQVLRSERSTLLALTGVLAAYGLRAWVGGQ